ncbi:hypothetical protein Aduo_012250 [Ancylostoma duodenale]
MQVIMRCTFRRSEGCIAEAFLSDAFQCKNKSCQGTSARGRNQGKGNEDDDGAAKSSSRLNIATGVENNLLEVLRKNYDIG